MNWYEAAYYLTFFCRIVYNEEKGYDVYPMKGMCRMANLLWTIIVALVVFWLLGFFLQIGGGLIHILLVIAGIIFIYQLIVGKRKL